MYRHCRMWLTISRLLRAGQPHWMPAQTAASEALCTPATCAKGLGASASQPLEQCNPEVRWALPSRGHLKSFFAVNPPKSLCKLSYLQAAC